MKINRINPDCATVQNGLPLYLQGKNDKAVLLIHGYNGYVHDVSFLANKLNKAGFTVSVPRNTGCGTDHTDFLSTKSRDWIRHAVDCYLDLKAVYKDVYLVGLSMGALISIILASHFKVKKLVLAAPAVILISPVLPFTSFLRIFIKKIKRNTKFKPLNPVNNRTFAKEWKFLNSEYWSWHYVPALYQLQKIRRQAIKAVKKVKSDTLVLASKSDLTVSLKTVIYLRDKCSAEKFESRIFEKSSHVITDSVEREDVAKAVIDWLIDKPARRDRQK
ncbi:MAG: alpha/beta fold hydrolase [Spirochaetes bacterium]|nr:alpha/beta fold hydrolase [Spirochaetota bacterium]MBN2769500.1 alpha/beta fold hydrolase [Spirochaetota bacterium]